MRSGAVNRLKAFIEDICRDRKLLVKIFTVVLILLTAVALKFYEGSKADITIEASDDITAEKEIYVDISGAVCNPGVYKANTKTRLYEVIEMAGGLRSDADTDSINQAAFVNDGEKIIIPVSNPRVIEQSESGEPPDADGSSDTSSDLININTADKSELMTLTGIGEVMADRIIEYRLKKRFRSIEDIKSVKGIGDSTFEKIKDSITA